MDTRVHFLQSVRLQGNTREKLFHTWQSAHFAENTETLDSYVMHIRQVAMHLGYGEPQILEVFKNTLPSKIILGIIPNRRSETIGRDSKKITD